MPPHTARGGKTDPPAMTIPNSRRASKTRGTAAVELAVCLPVLVFISLSTIHASDAIFLKQTLCVTAYETARVAIQDGATSGDASSAGTQILTARNVVNAVITLDPPDVSSVPRGAPITVNVTAPRTGNTVLPLYLYTSPTVVGTATMVKE